MVREGTMGTQLAYLKEPRASVKLKACYKCRVLGAPQTRESV